MNTGGEREPKVATLRKLRSPFVRKDALLFFAFDKLVGFLSKVIEKFAEEVRSILL